MTASKARDTTPRTLHVLITGAGPTVVFLHGLVGSHRYWRSTQQALGAHYQVVAFDLLGFGHSPKPHDSAYTREDQIQSILSSLRALGIGGRFILVGHSMGALIALGLAVQCPDLIDRLVLVGLPVFTSPEDARQRIRASGLVPELMVYGPFAHPLCTLMCALRPAARRAAPLLRRDVPRDVAMDVPLHTWPSYSRSLAYVIETHDVCADLCQLQTPVVILHGTRDAVTPVDRVQALTRCNERLRLHVTAATHNLPLERPEVVADAIRQGGPA